MTEFADQTWKSDGRASNQPKFLDRATFLARQASDRFSIMNLLDPSAFHDTDKGEKSSGNQGGLSFRENSEMMSTLGNLRQSSTLDERRESNQQDSFHESAAEFPSFFQSSEVQAFDTDLVDEVATSLSNLMKVADCDVTLPSDSVLIREERGKHQKKGNKEKKEKKGKKEKKKDKKGKKDKKEKKVKKDKEKGSESKQSSEVSCDESQSVDHQIMRASQTIHDDDKTTTSLQIEDLLPSRRKESRASKEVGSTKSSKAFSQSMPNVRQIHGFSDQRQGSRSRRNSAGTKPSQTKSVDGIITKEWTPSTEGQSNNFSALPFVKVKTTKLDASEFEESCAESCWSDDDDDDDSAWDSEATDLFAKRPRADKLNPNGQSSNASCVSLQSDSYAETTGLYRSVPLMHNRALDDSSIQSSASTGRIQERAPTRILNPGVRLPRSHVASFSQNRQALSLPSALGPRANSSNSLASSSSAGTGMSTSIADRSIKSREKSRSSKSKKKSKYHATIGTVEARGNGVPMQASIEGRSTHSTQSSLSSAPAHLASQKGEGRLKYAPSGPFRPEGSARGVDDFAVDPKGSDVEPAIPVSQVAPAIPLSPLRPRMLGIGLVGLAKARFGKSKLDKFRGSSPH